MTGAPGANWSPRDLPGHGRLLNDDLEEFLQRSQRRRKEWHDDNDEREQREDVNDESGDIEGKEGAAEAVKHCAICR